jgi:hypothetical protein
LLGTWFCLTRGGGLSRPPRDALVPMAARTAAVARPTARAARASRTEAPPTAGKPTVEAYIRAHGKERGAVLDAAAALLDDGLPGAKRGIKWGYPTWTGKGNVVALLAYDDHVNLQFFQGASLADPEGLLEGTGVSMRHVKIRSARDLKVPAVKALVRNAWRLDQA